MSVWLSIVAPVFNEEQSLEPYYQRLKEVLTPYPKEMEIIFINDGSTDRSLDIIRELRKKDSRVKVINFTRNFGHQSAIKAGIDFARGEALIIMDTDLQDAPEVVPQFISKWEEGYDVVYAVRKRREGKNIFKKLAYFLYYRLLKVISNFEMPVDVGDFRLISRSVANVLKDFKERNLYIRGLVSWIGFKQTGILVHRPARKAGETKYTFLKLLGLAWNGITHFSHFPLHMPTWMGLMTLLFTFVFAGYLFYIQIFQNGAVTPWLMIALAILFFGSVQLISLGILGSYVARNFDEARHRPLYLIKEKEGF